MTSKPKMSAIRPVASRIRLLSLLAVALLCLALAGACGDSEPTPTATLPPTPTPTPMPTATPTPDPVDLAIATVSAAAGGLTADSEACLRTLYTTTDMAGTDMARLQPGSREDPEATLLVFRFLLCLTNDEWQGLLALTGDYAIPEFSSSALRCVDEQIGIERFVEAIWGDSSQMPGETVQVLRSCGLEFFPLPSPGEGGEGAFNQVSLLWLMHDPALQGLIDCLREAASMQELDAFFSGSSASPPAGIPQCLGQYADMLPSGG